MNYQHNYQSFFYFTAAILLFVVILTGCAPQEREPIQVYPDRKSTAEAISILRSRSKNAVPLRAHGQCLWQYYKDGKPSKENFAVKLWVNPPVQVYLQGDIGFNARGIVLGSNENEFWLTVKPKISSYSWGKWSEQGSSVSLTNISRNLGEALGIVEFIDEENWSLSGEDKLDVLTKRDDKNTIIKKIYVGSGDCLVRKIEYFDAGGKAVAVAELNKYRGVSQGFFVPTTLRIIMHGEGVEDSAGISLDLKSIKPTSFTEKQRNHFFNLPETKGYKHIYQIIDGQMIEQPR